MQSDSPYAYKFSAPGLLRKCEQASYLSKSTATAKRSYKRSAAAVVVGGVWDKLEPSCNFCQILWCFHTFSRIHNRFVRYCPITTVLSVSGSRKRWLGEDSGRKVQEQGWVRAALTFQVLWYLVPFMSFTLSDCTSERNRQWNCGKRLQTCWRRPSKNVFWGQR